LLRVAVLCNQAKLQQQTRANRSRAPTEDGNVDDTGDDIEAPAAIPGTYLSPACSDISRSNNIDTALDDFVVVSTNGIDKALLTWGVGVGQAQAIKAAYKQEALLPFSNSTKLSAVVVRDVRTAGAAAAVFVKGAPEYVLAACTHFYTGSGEQCVLQSHTLTAVAAAVEKAASKGQRVVALAEIPSLDTTKYGPDYVFDVDPVANSQLMVSHSLVV
jgi:magnesium-transporting ATPase (P-type)